VIREEETSLSGEDLEEILLVEIKQILRVWGWVHDWE
jgi:hypothetical protein